MQQDRISPSLVAAIVATGLMSFSGVVSETAMNVTFPTLMRELGIGTSTVQWLTTGYLLALALVVPLSSFLKRRHTLRRCFWWPTCCFWAPPCCARWHPTFRCC